MNNLMTVRAHINKFCKKAWPGAKKDQLLGKRSSKTGDEERNKKQ